ncbi:hypothetical protein DFH09DRAFT_1069396 [Mycena vulgaris]|nr:hypothetical protein DFH09DRAFT_1069396 [Mycena vulgaris]
MNGPPAPSSRPNFMKRMSPQTIVFISPTPSGGVDVNKVVVEKIRSKWYRRASQPNSHGLCASGNVHTHIEDDDEESLRIELAGRTGDTDSEAEGAGVNASGSGWRRGLIIVVFFFFANSNFLVTIFGDAYGRYRYRIGNGGFVERVAVTVKSALKQMRSSKAEYSSLFSRALEREAEKPTCTRTAGSAGLLARDMMPELDWDTQLEPLMFSASYVVIRAVHLPVNGYGRLSEILDPRQDGTAK